MVERISLHLKETISKAIADAENRTDAEIMTVIAPAGHSYQSQVMLCGLGLGSLVDLGLWFEKTETGFPQLLAFQLGIMALLLFVPMLRNVCLKLVPAHIRRHHAAKRAFEEFHFASRHVPAGRPAVLLYVSLTERYVHILHNRIVADKIPDDIWEEVVREFTSSVKADGLPKASAAAIRHITDVLASHFPQEKK